jgi:predicted ATPase
MIWNLAVSGYRSLRDIRISLNRINVVTGANGSGKSSMYRSLRLMADISHGRIIQSLAAEGGLASTLWAGPETVSRSVKSGEHPVQGTRRQKPVALKLGFSGEDYGYAIDLGLPPPPPPPTAFSRDPEIKVEAVWTGEVFGRSNVFAERRGPAVRIRNQDGVWRDSFAKLGLADSVMTHFADLDDGTELLLLRERMRDWRFYDHLRTDRDAPARRPQIGTYTPILSGDGADLAAAVQTILEIGDGRGFQGVIEDAFPKSSVHVTKSENGYFDIEMHQHGLLRPLSGAELSEGTLRYILLAAALMSPRPPKLMILNEPEVSLHPDLYAPLARLIAKSAENSQIILVSHAPKLVAELVKQTKTNSIVLEKELGETHVRDNEEPSWSWPSR